jgi:hypothetical protein
MVYTEQIRNERAPVVCTRKNWDDPWVVQERLYCLTCEFSLGSIGTAQFIYHYGDTARNNYVWEDVAPLDLNNHWVKVTFSPTDPAEPAKNWYGVICMEELDIFGIDDAEQAGNQVLSAFSPEYILTRIQLTHSILQSGGKVIGAAHSFNGFKSDRTGSQIRSGNKHPSFTYFAENLKDETTVSDWTARDILEYLVKYCKATGIGPFPKALKNFELFVDMLAEDNYIPLEIPADGRTVYEILDDLFNASRGLAWQLVPRTTIESGFFIQVRSILHEKIDNVFGVSMSAAPVRVPFSIWSRRDVLSCRLRTDVSRKYDMVAVEGGPMGTVFTASKFNSELKLPARVEDGWTTAQRDSYLRGAKEESGYADLGYVAKSEKNDAIRIATELNNVYRMYKLTSDFDRTDSLYFEEGQEYLFPKVLNNNDITEAFHSSNSGGSGSSTVEAQEQWLDVMRIEPYLPLVESYDYSKSPVAKVTNGSQAFRRPFTYLQAKLGTTDVWIDPANQTHSVMDNERINIDFSVSTSPDDNSLALWVNPSRMPHCLQTEYAFDLTEESVKNVGVSAVQSRTGFSGSFMSTIYVRSSNNVLVTYPENVSIDSDFSSILVIKLRRTARLDYLNPNTIVGVSKNELQRTNGMVLRDDRPKMLQLAVRAHRWYSAPRASIDIKLASLSSELSTGNVITRFDYGAPQRIRTQNNTIISKQGSTSGPATVDNTLFGTQDGSALVSQSGVLLANYNETSTPGPTTDGSTITRHTTHSRYVNTVVSRVLYDFQNMTTAITTQFVEFNLARVFSDE